MTHSYGEDGFGVTAWVGIAISLVCMCVLKPSRECMFLCVSVCLCSHACM